MTDKKRLMDYSEAGGCGCKISPATLSRLLSNISLGDRNLLVGFNDFDDAAIYKLNGDQCLIITTDFFSPIVNDAYSYGAISAANALSDVYAMGGVPLTATAIMGWPMELPEVLAKEVLDGAFSKCQEAGILICGGHTIYNSQPLFGLSVIGTIQESFIKKNSTAKVGDLLYLTKPLGIGILSTAEKKGKLKNEDYRELLNHSLKLNNIGIDLGKLDYVTAMTDVTGFGLIGHLTEMCKSSNLSAKIYFDRLPVLRSVRRYLDLNIHTSGGERNWQSYNANVHLSNESFKYILSDPQTNGGLLVAIKKENHDDLIELFVKKGLDLVSHDPIGVFDPNDFSSQITVI